MSRKVLHVCLLLCIVIVLFILFIYFNISFQAAASVVLHHKNSVAQALIDLFPSIRFDKSKFSYGMLALPFPVCFYCYLFISLFILFIYVLFVCYLYYVSCIYFYVVLIL